VFDPNSSHWRLSKDVAVSLELARRLPEPAQSGFRKTLQRYAEEMSARHTENMATRFTRFLRDTGSDEVSVTSLLNWRAVLGEQDQWHLGGLKGFLIAWFDYGFGGISKDVVDLLAGWRIKGNDKGVAVSIGCPESGPYTDLEISAILDWANMAVTRELISFTDYAYLLTLAMTARRPIQISALRGKDLVVDQKSGATLHRVNFPRAKQRGSGFRGSFRSLAVVEDLYLVLRHAHQQSVLIVEEKIAASLPAHLRDEVPVFINKKSARALLNLDDLSSALLGLRPDLLHERTDNLASALCGCAKLSTARSERTGEFIRLTATRFRYTRGTKLRREGFGEFVIAELLDHSDVQNVRVYTENTAQEAMVINELIGAQLAPFAQACMGQLVRSEREAIRGGDPRSRVPNNRQNAVGTCGNYGFCASGYRACYTCHHFQPWVEGPHGEVLSELYAEKDRTRRAGCAEVVVNANDQLILAVEHCISLCRGAVADSDATGQLRIADHD
jgi:integrase